MEKHFAYMIAIFMLLASISMEVRGRCSVIGSYFAGIYGIERDCTETDGSEG